LTIPGRLRAARERLLGRVQSTGRAATSVQDDGARIWARRGTDLTSTFPEITGALEAQLDPGVVLDSDLVVWQDGRLAFEALQERMGRRPRTAAAAARGSR
jgi:ATP-dependent DNA ligase